MGCPSLPLLVHAMGREQRFFFRAPGMLSADVNPRRKEGSKRPVVAQPS
jgi:hypothetical protein